MPSLGSCSLTLTVGFCDEERSSEDSKVMINLEGIKTWRIRGSWFNYE